ncbi:MAG: hypothetical protein AAGI48_06505 [Verrucomicrobiota bacterium]
MNRAVRIALTLFASATILILLVYQRLQRLRTDIEGGLAEEAARSEGQMIIVGVLIAGLLAIGGFVLMIVAATKGRRKNLPRHE